MVKYRFAKRAAACLLTVALAATGMVGCASTSDDGETSVAADSATVDTDLSSPSSNDTDDTDDDGTYTNPYTLNVIDVFEIDYSEYVDASNWKDAVVTTEMATEPEYETQYAIAYQLLYTYGLTATDITDRGAQGGDTLTIDFVGYVDGEELENGSATDQTLMLGSGSYIDGFEEGLIGAEVGDEITLDLTFPDPYTNNTDLSGKAVTFEVTVTAITGFDEVSDDDISTATDGEYATYDDFVTAYTESRAEEYAELVIWNAVMEMVEELAVCETLSDDFINTYLYTYGTLAEAYGVDIETLLYYYYGTAITVEEFEEALTPTAEDYALQTCAVLAIADMEGITVSDEDVDAEYNEMLENYDSEEEMAEAGYSWSDVKFGQILDLVEEYIYDTIEIQD